MHVLQTLPVGGFRNWDRQGKEGFVRDYKGMLGLGKSHSIMRAGRLLGSEENSAAHRDEKEHVGWG